MDKPTIGFKLTYMYAGLFQPMVDLNMDIFQVN